MTIGYSITLALAIGLLIAYLLMVKAKEFWLTLLYFCVSVVNLGYLLLSFAPSVEFAIFANDLAYLGSVFLSMCMFLTIVRLCGFEIRKAHVITCLTIGALMFAIIATSGFLPLYYESVSLSTVDGVTKLEKVYGVLHPLYMIYLLGYFLAMLITIIHSVRTNQIGSPKLAGFIAGIVCSNIIVWLFEKFVNWEFEFLAVTYIISELLLLLLYWTIQDYIHKKDVPTPAIQSKTVVVMDSTPSAERVSALIALLPDDKALTPKETEILGELIEGKSRKKIAAEHHISENTVKTHVTHIYEKFDVSSKDALLSLLHKN